jgi:hypothetical protein
LIWTVGREWKIQIPLNFEKEKKEKEDEEKEGSYLLM